MPEFKYYERKAAGIVEIVNKEGLGRLGLIFENDEKPLDWGQEIERFKNLSKDPGVDQEKSFLAKYDEKTKRMVCLAGKFRISRGDNS